MSELSDPFQQRITIIVDTSTEALTVHLSEMSTFAAVKILEAVLDQLEPVASTPQVNCYKNGIELELPEPDSDSDDE
jgi:hypothetical protein